MGWALCCDSTYLPCRSWKSESTLMLHPRGKYGTGIEQMKECFTSWVPYTKQDLRKYRIIGKKKKCWWEKYAWAIHIWRSGNKITLLIFLHQFLEGIMRKVRYQSKYSKITCLIKVLVLFIINDDTTLTIQSCQIHSDLQVLHKMLSPELIPIL